MRGLRIWGWRAGVAGLAIVLVAAIGWTLATGWRPSTDTYPIQGVDVSEASGAIDWPVVRGGGADFAYILATHGADGRDTLFSANWSGAFAAGVRRGAVHGFSLCRLAVDQANNFMVFVPRVADALPAAVAIDESSDCATPPARQVLVDEVARFVAMVERHTGKPVILQISPAIERTYRLSAALDRTLWATGGVFPPTYFTRGWRIWRANGMRRIDGADHAVGWNVVAR